MDLEWRRPITQKGIALDTSEDKLKIQELEKALSMMVKSLFEPWKDLIKKVGGPS